MAFDFEDDFDLDSELDTRQQVAEYDGSVDESIEFYTEDDFRARGVNPIQPTPAKPGSEAKVLMLAARYAAGLPLWHERDCYDHGPAVEGRV